MLGDHVIGQALLFNHPATQGETQLGANGQGLLTQLMQAGLLQRQLSTHVRMPDRVQRTVRIEDHPAMGAHRAMHERQLHPLIGLDAAGGHRDHIGSGQQPFDEAFLRRAHKAVGLTVHIQGRREAWLIPHFAGGLKQGVVQINEHQWTINAHQRSPVHSMR